MSGVRQGKVGGLRCLECQVRRRLSRLGEILDGNGVRFE